MLRTPKCSRCRNHGFVVPVKGHAGNCRWKQCHCEKCCLITERQKITARQKAEGTQEADGRGGTGSGPGGAGAPASCRPRLGPEAACKLYPGRPEPLRPVPSPVYADFGCPLSINSDAVVGAEYLERDPSKMYLGYSTMYSCHHLPLGFHDASPAMQKGFRHVTCTGYQRGVLAPEPMGNFHPNYYAPLLPPPQLQQQPLVLPPGFLSGLQLLPPPPLPPPPPTFSLNIQSESSDDQDVEVQGEPRPPSSQEQSD
ncbi:Doublesex- and mab-3-related transcription factor B1 [Fukomys damarensis]|uniref:Doublesex-and mab-3-related transcription factor B1 n=1 Tax=Fukomys damarensis TaxID=885580 RepID=A0A091CPH2_FUKDA|nr:Doublesex- and mab-3-related transcription factor B1 [Fukomys damarensis]